MPTIDIEQTRTQARALLDSRIESVTTLVQSRQRITDLREQLTEAEREDNRAYVRATKDGWSPEELKKLWLDCDQAPPVTLEDRRRPHNLLVGGISIGNLLVGGAGTLV
jgi:hypothetical protein